MKTNLIKTLLLFVNVLSLSVNAYGNELSNDFIPIDKVIINGPNTVTTDGTETYFVNDNGHAIIDAHWTVSGATILSEGSTTISINWPVVGNYTINYTGTTKSGATVEGIYHVMVIPPPPVIPVIISQDCTEAILKRESPPNGVVWYWQGTNQYGTSISNASTTLQVTTSGRYYLRALQDRYWSDAVSVPVVLGSIGGQTWYADQDNDGLGDPNKDIISCSQPSGYVSNNNDQCPYYDGTGNDNGCPDFTGVAHENYIYTITPKIEITQDTELEDDEKVMRNITYFDGLGRPIQQIAHQSGGQGQDLISPIAYDEFGREAKAYLPYARESSSLEFDAGLLPNSEGSIAALNSFYEAKFPEEWPSNSTVNPYSEKAFEASPLNRVLEQAAPGKDWQLGGGHTIQYAYQTNGSQEVLDFGVTFTEGDTRSPTLTMATHYYDDHTLYKTVTKDENWRSYDKKDRTTEEFKNKQGQVILKRSYQNQQPHDTYYVYDDYGNLSYVLPPLASEKTNVYDVGTSSYGASHFVEGGSPTGSVRFSIEQTAPGTFEYVADFDLQNLSNSTFKTGYIMDLPRMHPAMGSYLYLGATRASGHSNGITSYRYVYYYAREGKLYCGDYTYSFPWGTQGSALAIDDFDKDTHISLPQNLSGFTESETQEQVEELLEKLCYQYKYDHRNRLIEKKIPGKGWESIVYDNLDRPVLTQDAIQKEQNSWLFTKYDVFGRVVYTGIYSSSDSRSTLQSLFNDKSAHEYYEKKVATGSTGYQGSYYSNAHFPTTDLEMLTINYYDDYEFDRAGTSSTITTAYGSSSTGNTKTLSTGTKVKVLDSNSWITTVHYYDDKARPIYTYSHNAYLGTTDIVENDLDAFTGRLEASKTTHKKVGSQDLITQDRFTYDSMDRLLSQQQQINSQPEELMVKNEYDALGQLIQKDVGAHETDPLQSIDYHYNIRGWLKKINDPFESLGDKLFSMELHYNDYGIRLYNGNISATHWKTASDHVKRRYNYYYDDLNRIKSAYYYTWGENSRFNLWTSYDKNGNIQRLYRRGAVVSEPDISRYSDYGTMDYLNYTYDGNQLVKVQDNGNDHYGFKDGTDRDIEYSYDANGNMVEDANKGISHISYYHLNLPKEVTLNGGNIKYTYDATGTKLRKQVGNSITDYAGNYVYQNGDLQFFNTPEGYATPNGLNEFDYIYQYKDHLGNVRLSYTKNPNTSQETVFTDGFESASGWDGSGNLYGSAISTFDSDFKRTGSYSGRIDRTSSGQTYVHSNDWVPIENSEDTYYTFSCWVYIEEVPDNRAELFLFMKTNQETGYYTDLSSVDMTTQNQWVLVEKSVLVPKEIDKLNVRIDNRHGGKVWFDDVKIVKGNTSKTLIVEERNYYPFGLKHQGYNDVTSSSGNSMAQKNKMFQGQRLDDELGLNWYGYKYRNYDPAMGRFMSIDPLAEDYVYNSTYAFQENKLGLGVELEGLELAMFDWLKNTATSDAAKNPNGVGAHALGISQGLANTVTGTIDAISNPVQTLSAMGDLASPLPNSTKIKAAIGVSNSVDTVINGDGIDRGTVVGEVIGAVVGAKGANLALKGASAALKGTKVANAVPSILARVVPADVKTTTLGAPNASDVFVTAAKDISGLNATQVAKKLTIPQSSSGFNVIEFSTPKTGLASPINRTNPGFVGKGRTAGGAREFTVPNQKIPKDAKTKKID